jgi:rhodanese-related sulfurtransferase
MMDIMIQTLTPLQAHELLMQGDVDVIDVREPHEWLGGHLPGSRHIPLGRFREGPKAALPRDGVIFVCAAGVRSHTAARLAEAVGLTRIYNMAGGTRSWQSAGLPLVTSDASAAA